MATHTKAAVKKAAAPKKEAPVKKAAAPKKAAAEGDTMAEILGWFKRNKIEYTADIARHHAALTDKELQGALHHLKSWQP